MSMHQAIKIGEQTKKHWIHKMENKVIIVLRELVALPWLI